MHDEEGGSARFQRPSEFGTSITITITPDTITQDEPRRALVAVTARDPTARRSPTCRQAEIRVNGTHRLRIAVGAQPGDGRDGRATLVYTAPAGPSGLAVDAFTIVDIGVTPIGNNFGNAATRFASAVGSARNDRGAEQSAAGLHVHPDRARRTPDRAVRRIASTAPLNNPIVSYTWDFDDGTTASGRTVGHAFNAADTYIVTLTVADAIGRTARPRKP